MELLSPPASLLNNASLFLDFDGTLTDLAPSPDQVRLAPELPHLLTHLHRVLEGRLAIVTGRSIASLKSMLGDVGIAIVGSHGIEFALDGQAVTSAPRPAALGSMLKHLQAFADDRPGLLIEDKPFGIGVHYRKAPGLAEDCRAEVERLIDGTDLELLSGKMVFEIRLGGCDKGTALRHLMQAEPFCDGRPIFIGDDITDEHGFAEAIEQGGHAVIVGDRRPTAADFGLEEVETVLDWLREASGFTKERARS
jgi:trehalose 6-phosphate phosphatase